ncbi:phosphate/phosphite/phosphonate ABC transporter substrate-binding protein [Kamptonema cortianum]|nr:phosphate/phosphite/phosphonate ABC transporter substrate-binding protein [Kamptonema cortianum]MDL5049744.1 phosphate/phosphite/phosphonate ABC transporter substrate-binding protein [Oscillatoria amoena NRMC-F 0135]
MKMQIAHFGLMAVAGLILSACSKPSTQTETGGAEKAVPSIKKFVVALKPDKDPEKMFEERGALAEYLKGKLGRDVEVVIPTSGAVILEGLGNGTIDLAYLSATDMVTSKNQDSGEILLAGEIEGKTTYESYWITLKGKPYKAIADIKGKPVAFSSKTSTSGGIVPIYDLIKQGLVPAGGKPEDFFGEGNVWYGSGYVSAAERVLNGEAEAAAVSYYVLDLDKHLSAEQRGKLRKLQAQGPVPTHVLAVRSSLSPDDKTALKSALLGMNDADYEGLRDKVFTSKLVEVDEREHLEPIREALSGTAHLR